MKEIWKKFEKNYSISNLGRIKNNNTQRVLKMRLSQGSLNTTGMKFLSVQSRMSGSLKKINNKS